MFHGVGELSTDAIRFSSVSLDTREQMCWDARTMQIREAIQELATRWFNAEFAKLEASRILSTLLAEAFLRGEPRHSPDGLLLLEANKRLQKCALNGEYSKNDYFCDKD